MNNLLLLYKMQWIMFVNRFFGNKKQAATSIAFFLAIITFFVLVVRFLNARFFYDLQNVPQQEIQVILALIFIISFAILFTFQLFSSLTNLVANFYKSPDLNYFVTTPLNPGVILIFKLINHTFISIGKESLLFFPFYISLAISINATTFFYILLPIVYFIVAAMAASIGIIIGMLLLKKLSIKSYRYIVNIGNFLAFVLVWGIVLTDILQIPQPIIKLAERVITEESIILIIPFVSGAELLTQIASGFKVAALKPLAYLLAVATFILFLTYFIAKHNFFTGWMNNSYVKHKQKNKKLKSKRNLKVASNNLHPIFCVVKNEWIRATKNYDIMAGALVLYGLYIAMLFYLSSSDISFNLIISAAMLGGMFLVTTGTSVLLISSEIILNPYAAKYQFSILKFLPLKAKDVLTARLIMNYVPSAVILSMGLSGLLFSIQQTMFTLITIVLIQLIILLGYTTLNQSYEIIYYQCYYKKQNFLGGLISFVAPAIYLILTIGLFILYQAKPLFSSSWINVILNMPTIATIAIVTIVLQLTYTYRLGAKAWDKMEF
ncbi:hypothetical protein PRVXT_001930 [Proteinivorax tanatarense]|uniref:ABC transporter permease n=1 Tax=Proteinivorax tanatarense TaxID=1260629 RepID=A0AAU7VIN9_9FIRM